MKTNRLSIHYGEKKKCMQLFRNGDGGRMNLKISPTGYQVLSVTTLLADTSMLSKVF